MTLVRTDLTLFLLFRSCWTLWNHKSNLPIMATGSALQNLFDSLVSLTTEDEKAGRPSTSSSMTYKKKKPRPVTFPTRSSKTKTTPPPPPSSSQDLQDLNALARLRCWSAIEQCASTVDSIHHVTLTAEGNGPLHSAISNGAPLSTVQALVVANPPSVARGNKFGNTPLHFVAWKNKYPDSFAIVQFLLEYYPQSAKVLNKHGNLPLHHAANYKAHPDIVQVLYRAYPKAVTIPNDQGKTPLDYANLRLTEHHPVVTLLQGTTSRNYVYVQHNNNNKANTKLVGRSPNNSTGSITTASSVVSSTTTGTPISSKSNGHYSPQAQEDHQRYSTAKEELTEIRTDTWHEVDL